MTHHLYNDFISFVLLHSLCYVLPFDPFRHKIRESAGRGKGMPVPPANPVALGEADIRPVVAYHYQEDEMIGGQSDLDIRTRLLRSKAQPSAEEIYLAHINAQDRFEVKVDIIQQMAVLDLEPSGGPGQSPCGQNLGGGNLLNFVELYRLRDEIHAG
ncbi:hypothetical protein Lal_00012903 [Lupinus albus]|nr:hypothetical protein Lal_00012903 [Lupinus albus]